MPYLLHKTWCPDPVAVAASIPDEANCSWLHQSQHCEKWQIVIKCDGKSMMTDNYLNMKETLKLLISNYII